ncbi:hypothetical protein AAE478_009294 [Parahypoxylon ruwenzoriense]
MSSFNVTAFWMAATAAIILYFTRDLLPGVRWAIGVLALTTYLYKVHPALGFGFLGLLVSVVGAALSISWTFDVPVWLSGLSLLIEALLCGFTAYGLLGFWVMVTAVNICHHGLVALLDMVPACLISMGIVFLLSNGVEEPLAVTLGIRWSSRKCFREAVKFARQLDWSLGTDAVTLLVLSAHIVAALVCAVVTTYREARAESAHRSAQEALREEASRESAAGQAAFDARQAASAARQSSAPAPVTPAVGPIPPSCRPEPQPEEKQEPQEFSRAKPDNRSKEPEVRRYPDLRGNPASVQERGSTASRWVEPTPRKPLSNEDLKRFCVKPYVSSRRFRLAPVAKPEPVLEPAREPVSVPVAEPVPAPEPVPVPVLEPEQVLESAPEPAPVLVPEPEQVLESAPVPVYMPVPVLEQVQEPATVQGVFEPLPEPVNEYLYSGPPAVQLAWPEPQVFDLGGAPVLLESEEMAVDEPELEWADKMDIDVPECDDTMDIDDCVPSACFTPALQEQIGYSMELPVAADWDVGMAGPMQLVVPVDGVVDSGWIDDAMDIDPPEYNNQPQPYAVGPWEPAPQQLSPFGMVGNALAGPAPAFQQAAQYNQPVVPWGEPEHRPVAREAVMASPFSHGPSHALASGPAVNPFGAPPMLQPAARPRSRSPAKRIRVKIISGKNSQTAMDVDPTSPVKTSAPVISSARLTPPVLPRPANQHGTLLLGKQGSNAAPSDPRLRPASGSSEAGPSNPRPRRRSPSPSLSDTSDDDPSERRRSYRARAPSPEADPSGLDKGKGVARPEALDEDSEDEKTKARRGRPTVLSSDEEEENEGPNLVDREDEFETLVLELMTQGLSDEGARSVAEMAMGQW